MLLAALVLIGIVAIGVGTVSIPPLRVASLLVDAFHAPWSGRDADPELVILMAIRVPRVLVAGLVGAALAVAGTQMQGLFQNPMASPDVIGTSTGAALGAVLAFVLGLAQSHMMWMPALSCLGAALSLAVVYALTTRRGRTPVAMLLLAGVALNALLGSLTAFVISLQWVRYEVAQEVVFWLMGGLDDRTWTHVWMAAPLVAHRSRRWPPRWRAISICSPPARMPPRRWAWTSNAPSSACSASPRSCPALRWPCAASSASSA